MFFLLLKISSTQKMSADKGWNYNCVPRKQNKFIFVAEKNA